MPFGSLSSRRRVLVRAGLAIGLAVGLVGGLAVGLATGLFRATRPPLAAPQDRPGPVLLVPGYGGSGSALAPLAARLRSAGRDVVIIRLPGNGTGDLRGVARAIAKAADRALAAGAPSVDVVGYSAGGVATRWWAREDGDARAARRIVTLGSPHHGTDVAALAETYAADGCPPACRQLAPASDLLRTLNTGDETPDGPRWVSVWTSDDRTVTPPASARLAGAVDVEVQAVCPGLRVAHGDLPGSPVVLGIVLRAVAVAEPTPPRPGDCASLRALGG